MQILKIIFACKNLKYGNHVTRSGWAGLERQVIMRKVTTGKFSLRETSRCEEYSVWNNILGGRTFVQGATATKSRCT